MSEHVTYKKKCIYCGKSFIARKSTTKYCSIQCNKKHYREKKQREKKENKRKKNINDQRIEFLQKKAYLSISETAEMFAVSRTTIWRMIKRGQFKPIKIGHYKYISKKQIEELFENKGEMIQDTNQATNNKEKRSKLYNQKKVWQKISRYSPKD